MKNTLMMIPLRMFMKSHSLKILLKTLLMSHKQRILMIGNAFMIISVMMIFQIYLRMKPLEKLIMKPMMKSVMCIMIKVWKVYCLVTFFL